MLDWTEMDIPLIAGLETGDDPRALEPPALLRADNVAWDKTRGVNLRRPYAPLPTTISDIRRLATYEDELLAFTKNRLYSWSPAMNEWQDRGEHLAIELTEKPVFTRELEQHTCDRAELDGVVVFVWDEGGTAKVAALDSETGALLAGPAGLPNDSDRTARIVAVGQYFHIYSLDSSGNLFVDFFLPSEVIGFIGGTAGSNDAVSAAAIGNSQYDVAVGDDDVVYVVWQHTTTTSYKLNTVTAAGVADTETTKTLGGGSAGDADGVVAIAVDTDNDLLCVMRAQSTNIRADIYDVAFSLAAAADIGDVAAADTQLTCAWRKVAESDGSFRCYGFWTGAAGTVDAAINGAETRYNYIEDDGTAGTAATLQFNAGLASKAFAHEGKVYVWTAFAGTSSALSAFGGIGFRTALQNGYFLRDDAGGIHARAVADRAGGFSQTTGMLPHVQLCDDGAYRWAGVERLVIPLEDASEVETVPAIRVRRPTSFGAALGRRRATSKKTGYAKRSPVEISLSFDSDTARRTTQIGKTLYITGGMITQYDGHNLTELGFFTAPWYFGATTSAGTPSTIETGDYAYKSTYAWVNAKNELDRSTSAISDIVNISATEQANIANVAHCHVTRKTGDIPDAVLEHWRTLKNPNPSFPFYLVTDVDPSNTSGDNHYELNNPSAETASSWSDEYGDATARTKQPNPENGGILENLPAPAATIIWANDERVFLAGIVDDPYEIRYSKIRSAGEVVSFHDALSVTVPDKVTAIVEQADTLVALCESSIYVLAGVGYDNLGAGQNYGPAQVRSIDVGALGPESTVLTSLGTIFKSAKGWHLLDLGFNVTYIGKQVEAYDDEVVRAIHIVEDAHEIRVVSDERILVFNTKARAWSSFTETGGVSACVYNGTYHYATEDAVKYERDDYEGVDYGFDIEWAPISFGGIARFGRVKRFQPRGERVSAHDLRVRVKYNDEADYTDDRTHKVADSVQYRLDPGPGHGFSRPRCQSAQIRLTTQAPGVEAPPDGEAMRLTGLSVRIGRKPGLGRLGPGRR